MTVSVSILEKFKGHVPRTVSQLKIKINEAVEKVPHYWFAGIDLKVIITDLSLSAFESQFLVPDLNSVIIFTRCRDDFEIGKILETTPVFFIHRFSEIFIRKFPTVESIIREQMRTIEGDWARKNTQTGSIVMVGPFEYFPILYSIFLTRPDSLDSKIRDSLKRIDISVKYGHHLHT